MKRTFNILTALAVMTLFAACSVSENMNPDTGREERVPIFGTPVGAPKGEILVKFSPEVSEMLDKAGLTKAGGNDGAMLRSGVVTFDEVLDIVGGYEIERVFPVDTRHDARTRDNGLHLWYVVRFDESEDVRTVADKFSRISELTTIQYSATLKRNNNRKPIPAAPVLSAAGIPAAGAFDDPGLERQWHYINKGYIQNGDVQETMIGADGKSTMQAGSDVNVQKAWEKCTGDPSIIVAVMDEGVMWSHPDLIDNMWVNEGEEWLGIEDVDGNGYKGDKYGYNFVQNSGVITWDHLSDVGHGTHVAGTIAAVNNNNRGVCGIAGGNGSANSGVKIMSLQTFAGDNGADILSGARAIKYAADNGAVILQCSWGYISALADRMIYGNDLGPKDDEGFEAYNPLEVEAFDYFIYNAGSKDGVIDGGVVIFASGNEFAAMPSNPAAYKDYICVSAIAADYTPSSYTNYGKQVDVCAPGGDTNYHLNDMGGIYSTLPPHVSDGLGYGYMDGTSMACPHMSGVAALGLAYAAQQHRHFNSREYRDLLIKAVQPIDPHFYITGNDGQPTNRPRSKTFYNSWSVAGPVSPNRWELTTFVGKSGKGLTDASKLLDMIDGTYEGEDSGDFGHDMKLTNMTVKIGGTTSVALSRCFEDGEKAGAVFNAVSENTTVATVKVEGSTLKVTGVATGFAKIRVTCNNETQEAYVTVRKNLNDNGII